MSNNNRLRIAIQKGGRLSKDCQELLKQLGVKLNLREQRLIAHSTNMPIDVLHEEQQYLVLGGLFEYSGRLGYLVRYINKETLEMRSSVTMNPAEVEYENQIYDQCSKLN